MNIRSLLVLLDGADPHCAARTQVAIRLSRRLRCHLFGLAPAGRLDPTGSPGPASALAKMAADVRDTLHDRAEQAAAVFLAACRGAGLESFDAVVDCCDWAESLVQHARCSDLTLLGQGDPVSPNCAADRELVLRAVFDSARPTLQLPYAGRVDDCGSRVMVAWDDSREAARAIGDALPLLCLADHVEIVHWSEQGGDGGDGGSGGGSNMAMAATQARFDALGRWLGRHAIHPTLRVEPAGPCVADSMLSHAADIGADLIVMGAFGHSRLVERVFGGATRGMLAAMTVPVLMSH